MNPFTFTNHKSKRYKSHEGFATRRWTFMVFFTPELQSPTEALPGPETGCSLGDHRPFLFQQKRSPGRPGEKEANTQVRGQ